MATDSLYFRICTSGLFHPGNTGNQRSGTRNRWGIWPSRHYRAGATGRHYRTRSYPNALGNRRPNLVGAIADSTNCDIGNRRRPASNQQTTASIRLAARYAAEPSPSCRGTRDRPPHHHWQIYPASHPRPGTSQTTRSGYLEPTTTPPASTEQFASRFQIKQPVMGLLPAEVATGLLHLHKELSSRA
jgi:hypothetical protein